MSGNIKLEYRMDVAQGDFLYHTRRAEFFLDEHGIQWIKFYPSNGPSAGREHIMRTDLPNFHIVKREDD